MKNRLIPFTILIASQFLAIPAFAQATTQSLEDSKGDPDNRYSAFGFGPALYMINYDEEVISDSKDVTLRGDGAITASGSDYNTVLGLEVHYDFSFSGSRSRPAGSDEDTPWVRSRGHTLSPYLGIYDIEDGIKGLAYGVMYGFWRGDGEYGNRKALNISIGRTVHRDQLVLADGIREGVVPAAALKPEDYTTRKDVNGWTLMLSYSVGF